MRKSNVYSHFKRLGVWKYMAVNMKQIHVFSFVINAT